MSVVTMTTTTNIDKGDRLQIRLNSNEVFEGSVQRANKNSIELFDIRKNGEELDGNLVFYRSEIAFFNKVGHHTKDRDADSGASCGGSEIEDVAPVIKMEHGEFKRLEAMINNYTYMLHKDQDYKAALNRLREVQTVGVASLGNPLCLLAMATWCEVFIFDVAQLGFDELRPILESNDICKVLHGGAKLHRCLRQVYGIEMKNVFDTQIADSYMASKRGLPNGKRNLAQCTAFNLNFPVALLQSAMEFYEDEKYWKSRPIIKVGKVMAAQLVAYLITLRDHFQSLMLKDVTDATKRIYIKVRDTDNNTMLQEQLKLVSHSS